MSLVSEEMRRGYTWRDYLSFLILSVLGLIGCRCGSLYGMVDAAVTKRLKRVVDVREVGAEQAEQEEPRVVLRSKGMLSHQSLFWFKLLLCCC